MSRARRAKRNRDQVPRPPVSKASKMDAPKKRNWRLFYLVIGGILIFGAAWFRLQATSNPLLHMPTIEPDGLLPNVAAAIHEGQAAILKDPDSAEVWGTYGLVLLAHEFRREALVSFQEAERLAPEDYRWSYYVGMTEGMFDAAKAAAAFERAVRKAPERNSVRLRLAEWYFDLRNLDGCEAQVRVALKQQPDSPRAQLIMARLYYERGQMEQSLQWALKATQSPRGNRRDVHELLARLYQRLGDPKAARKQVELAERLPYGVAVWDDPEMGVGATYLQDASVLNALAAASRARGDIDQCLQLLYRVVKFDSRNVLWKEHLAQTLIDYGKYKEALRFLTQATQDHPDSAEMELLYGRALLAVGKPQDAVRALNGALKKKPDYGAAFDYLGRALLALGQREEALQAWQRALVLRADDGAIRVRLAKLLIEKGDSAAARDQLLKARENGRESADVNRLLQQIEEGGKAAKDDNQPGKKQ